MTTLYQVDAFAARPFEGNPAAVVPLDAPADEGGMQAVAMEMNLSETAFLWPEDDGWRLRWFTPLVEVDLCGHATLASAHVLWEAGMLAAGEPARFATRSGRLTCTRDGDWITMDFPADPPAATPPAPGVLDALSVEQPVFAGRSSFDAFVALDSETAVRQCAPDMSALAARTERGAIVTAPADDAAFDFVSRFFAPAVGIDEDPVTGSAHCALAVYWSNRLGRDALTGRQISRRGGTVRVVVAGDRVRISGQAITVLRGDLSA
jgi:PhzF family phenazine biosynthesis protein